MATEGLTINEAAETTGWSSRMLRYIERIGLVVPPRSPSGYRLYGAAELQRLRTLRDLLAEHDVALGEVGFARRMSLDSDLSGAVGRMARRHAHAPRRHQPRRLAEARAGQAHAPPRLRPPTPTT